MSEKWLSLILCKGAKKKERKRKYMRLRSLIGIKRHHRICMMFEIQKAFNRLGGLRASDPSYKNTA